MLIRQNTCMNSELIHPSLNLDLNIPWFRPVLEFWRVLWQWDEAEMKERFKAEGIIHGREMTGNLRMLFPGLSVWHCAFCSYNYIMVVSFLLNYVE